MKIVVDTSVFIDYLRRKQKLDTLYAQIQLNNELLTSLVTFAEVFSGKSAQPGGEQRETIIEIIKGIEVVTPTLETARIVGSLRYKHDLTLGDAFVAALALEENCPVATLNTRHFRSIPSLTLHPTQKS